jgi:hypothetical protein
VSTQERIVRALVEQGMEAGFFVSEFRSDRFAGDPQEHVSAILEIPGPREPLSLEVWVDLAEHGGSGAHPSGGPSGTRAGDFRAQVMYARPNAETAGDWMLVAVPVPCYPDEDGAQLARRAQIALEHDDGGYPEVEYTYRVDADGVPELDAVRVLLRYDISVETAREGGPDFRRIFLELREAIERLVEAEVLPDEDDTGENPRRG